MGLGTRFKQLVMVTGLLTILAVTALVGVVVYLWFDSRGESTDYEVDTDFEPDIESETTDEDIDTSDTETGDTAESDSDAVAS